MKVAYRISVSNLFDLFAEGTAEVFLNDENDFEHLAHEVTILSCAIAGADVNVYGNHEFPADLLEAIERAAIERAGSDLSDYRKAKENSTFARMFVR